MVKLASFSCSGGKREYRINSKGITYSKDQETRKIEQFMI